MVAALSLTLAACGASNSGSGSGQPTGSGSGSEAAIPAAWQSCQVGGQAKSVTDTQGTGQDKKKEIKIGAFNGWDESFATAHLLKAILTEQGYQVSVQSFEAAPAFAGTAGGDIDLVTDVWLPTTHASYIQQYGNQLVPLGCWYDNAKLTIAVNDSSPAKSIADLATMGDQYNNVLYGIEPGAGLTKQTQQKAIPEYGIKMEFRVSSTPAMLAEVSRATQAGQNVAVTLWRPHWAYSAFPMRDLEDPKGAMGGAETIYSAGRPGLDTDNPKLAQIVKNMALTDDQLSGLEDLMMNKYKGENHDAAVAEWLQANPDFKQKMLAGTLHR
ncbi:glycine betaine ABC transporter substrate-binding protein [Granulicoccus phenolivorans]|uniref:glycine betaine ABC transporter substrate-binding protein n=1 Tax=Granulicoccus phenolivorans TaxID=266854 RepID=UPI0004016A0F|nr:glycine betaine ABC transporter substrate-binding protein [Granulicoccus phenolivorans]